LKKTRIVDDQNIYNIGGYNNYGSSPNKTT